MTVKNMMKAVARLLVLISSGQLLNADHYVLVRASPTTFFFIWPIVLDGHSIRDIMTFVLNMLKYVTAINNCDFHNGPRFS